MRLNPKRNYVWLREVKEEKSKGGIYMPEKRAEGTLSMIGEVIAVGPGVLSDKTGETVRDCLVKEGDRVAFIAYGANRISFEGVEYIIIEDTQVQAVLTDD